MEAFRKNMLSKLENTFLHFVLLKNVFHKNIFHLNPINQPADTETWYVTKIHHKDIP